MKMISDRMTPEFKLNSDELIRRTDESNSSDNSDEVE